MKTFSDFTQTPAPLTYCVRPLSEAGNWLALIDSLPSSQALVWLDSAKQHEATGRYSVLAMKPWLTLESSNQSVQVTTRQGTIVESMEALQALQTCLNLWQHHESSAPLSQALGLFVALGYGLNHEIEPRVGYVGDAEVPDLCLWGMQQVLVQDHRTNQAWAVGVADPYAQDEDAQAQSEALADELVQLNTNCLKATVTESKKSSLVFEIEPSNTQTAFEAGVREAQRLIGEGDIFQANLAQRFQIKQPINAWALYKVLREVNPSPFACFVRHKDWTIVSCSPERLVKVDGDKVEARPIAGTRPRGKDAREDTLQSFELMMSEKENAEHVMLVDLARNDLGRICEAGTVKVDELLGLEWYSHVIHIVSNVVGQLLPGTTTSEVIQAVFPGGTITGCPKVRCMQILNDLEPVARGFYTGSVGYLGFNGDLDLNILIRTLLVTEKHTSFHVGAGIVADSDPEREYHETLAKAKAMIEAIQHLGKQHAQTHSS